MTTEERIHSIQNGWKFYIAIIIFALSLYFLRYVFRYVSEKQLFLLGSISYIIIGTYLILNVDGILRSDPQYVFESAQRMNNGDFTSLHQTGLTNYLGIFPNQVGLVSFFRVYEMISSNVKLIWFFQLLMVLGIYFFLWKITDLLFKNILVNKYLIVLSYTFLPPLFLILWAYGDIPGLLFLLISTFYTLRFEKNPKIIYIFPIFIFIFLSCLVRANYAIFGIAIISVMFLRYLTTFRKRILVIIMTIILGISTQNVVINAYYNNIEKVTIPKGAPSLAWVKMGLDDKAATNGYWDTYTTLILINNQFDQDRVKNQVQSDFEDRIEKLSQDHNYFFQFFYEKLMGTWNEPTFQSIYTGPLLPRGQEANSVFLKRFYEQGDLYLLYNFYCGVIMFVIYSLSLVNIIKVAFLNKESLNDIELLPYVYLIGGFLFHLLWETKSRYVFSYIILLLPIVANTIYNSVPKNLKKEK